jgi:hypothetical protein
LGRDDELSTAVSRNCYVRESQHAMRYRRRAEPIHQPESRQALLNISAQEQKHADSVRTQIHSLGRQIPEVIPVHVEKNRIWQYLRTDLDEEERCA